MAIGIGFIVGFAVRKFGKGRTIKFGIVGGVLSLFGCLLGNILAISILISSESGRDILEVLSDFDFDQLYDYIKYNFGLMSLFFYGLAVYYGFRYSIMQEVDVKKDQANI